MASNRWHLLFTCCIAVITAPYITFHKTQKSITILNLRMREVMLKFLRPLHKSPCYIGSAQTSLAFIILYSNVLISSSQFTYCLAIRGEFGLHFWSLRRLTVLRSTELLSPQSGGGLWLTGHCLVFRQWLPPGFRTFIKKPSCRAGHLSGSGFDQSD